MSCCFTKRSKCIISAAYQTVQRSNTYRVCLCFTVTEVVGGENGKWKRKGQIWSDAKALFQWSKRAVTEFYTCKGVRAYMGIRYASRWLHFFTFIRLSPHSFDDSPIVSFYTRPDIRHNDKNAHSQTPSRPPTYGFTTTI